MRKPGLLFGCSFSAFSSFALATRGKCGGVCLCCWPGGNNERPKAGVRCLCGALVLPELRYMSKLKLCAMGGTLKAQTNLGRADIC